MSLKVRVRSNLVPLAFLFVTGCITESPAERDDLDAPADGDLQASAAEVMPYQAGDTCRKNFPQLARQVTPISIGGRNTQIDYKLVGSGNRLKVAQGDIIVGLEGGSRGGAGGLSGVGYVGLGKLWPNGRIPYVIDSHLDPVVRTNLMTAMTQWQNGTPIKFVEKEPTDSVFANIVPMPEGAEGSCFSYPGRLGETQDVYLGDKCSTGNIAHELGHLIGLFHEQARTDRDKYIEVLYSNVIPDYCDQFNTIAGIPEAENVESYDFGSIMHYAADAFAKVEGTVTIKIRPGAPVPAGVKMGQRDRPSSGDLATVRKMYGAK